MNDAVFTTPEDISLLLNLKEELTNELANILAYWLNNMQDEEHGGFYGRRLWDESLVAGAAKSAVLNARIVWTFSAAARKTNNAQYTNAAHRAYHYFIHHFIDPEFSGVYWSVSFDGKPLDTKKQVYAQSFAIYALAEYALLTGNNDAKQIAVNLFELIETYSLDKKAGGYFEAFTREWQEIADVRLSEKDANEKKTMNTHLHVLEAYTNLYRIHTDNRVKKALVDLLKVFTAHIIDKNHHLVLFFNEQWNRKGMQVSYGHDIEAAWLLYEAAEIIADEYWTDEIKKMSLAIVDASTEGLDKDHGLWYEYDLSTKHMLAEKHWWPQAEAMVGFIHAWQLTKNRKYLLLLIGSWQFINEHLIDIENAEWKWGIHADGSAIKSEDKAGFWKCPYHNSRACMEVISRIEHSVNLPA